ncbi:MAG: hypothetical protein ABIM64_01695 [candidate division WOR-3 bacterium]
MNYTTSDISVFVPSIIGGAMSALNDYINIIVLIGIVGGLALGLGALVRAFTRVGSGR